ncbi:hypothetical protein [Pyrobaculum aerophilum]|uniref:Uncharacterized protein n=1 Tax=Pyrobaculum aerophilum TaxID=13773 RepID=A0A371R6L9_9CREN|nr:hypothetical protein [Pyrobaculum aerophilum]RFB00139.1 hypothetical protein CGL52_02030 [Pyrobaculum aerophilum]
MRALRATGAGVPEDRPKGFAHLGFAPAEFAFAVPAVRAVYAEEVLAWREGKWGDFLNMLKSLAAGPGWERRVVDEVKRKVPSAFDLHVLLYEHVEEYREFLQLWGVQFSEEALTAFLKAWTAPAYVHWVLGQAGERPEAFELLRECDVEACLYAISYLSGIDAYRALARARGAPWGGRLGTPWATCWSG